MKKKNKNKTYLVIGALVILLILMASCFMTGGFHIGPGGNETTTTTTATTIPYDQRPCSELCQEEHYDGGWGPVSETSVCYEESSNSYAVIFGGTTICCCWDDEWQDSTTSIYVPDITTTTVPVAWVCCMGQTTFFCAQNICPQGSQYLWMTVDQDYCQQNCG